MYRNVLLTLHILGVAAWLGANLTQALVMPRLTRQIGPVATAWMQAAGAMTRSYYNVAGITIGVTGSLLVTRGGWGWGSGFVVLGITTLAVGAALGIGVFGPLATRMVRASDGGDASAFARLRTRYAGAAVADTALVVITLVAMVSKWRAR